MNPPRASGMPDPSSFAALVGGLGAQASIFLGVLANPLTGRHEEQDLPRARVLIDTLQMLEERTKGNLSEQEAKFLEHVLTDLRLRYVELESATES